MNKKDHKIYDTAQWVLAGYSHDFIKQKIVMNFNIIVDGVFLGQEEKVIRLDSVRPDLVYSDYEKSIEAFLKEKSSDIASAIDKKFKDSMAGKKMSKTEKDVLKADITEEVKKLARIEGHQLLKKSIFDQAQKEVSGAPMVNKLLSIIGDSLKF